MTWADGIAIGIILLSGLLAAARGFVREILGVVAWICSGLIALAFYSGFEPWVLRFIPNPKLALPLTILGIFLVVLIILTVIVSFIASLVRDSVLSGLDRTLGLLFGFLRGGVIVCLLLVFLSIFLQPPQWPAAVTDAKLLPATETGASLLITLLPAQYRPALNHPKAGAAAKAKAHPSSPPPVLSNKRAEQ